MLSLRRRRPPVPGVGCSSPRAGCLAGIPGTAGTVLREGLVGQVGRRLPLRSVTGGEGTGEDQYVPSILLVGTGFKAGWRNQRSRSWCASDA